MNISGIESLAKQIRIDSLQMCHDAKSSHIGSCLSCADILAVLYGGILKVNPVDPEWPERDRFILSKGHACAALYAVLAERGFFPKERLKEFYKGGSFLIGHASHKVPGVDVSTGSLGDGLSIGCGMALANPKSKVYVLMGDGDLNEGSTWEAAMFAGHHKLRNLKVIIDRNYLQALGDTRGILSGDIGLKGWAEFGWSVHWVSDGRDLIELISALESDDTWNINKPTCVIANTIKGCGVSFYENRVDCHYRHPNDQELKMALEELS